ncbi:MAG: hypothetical protein QM776_02155 [Rhodocyclaceae bacterium]
MRAGWNPGKRNRNVGTKAHGHGEDNKLVIPESRHQLVRYWERLTSYVLVKRQIGNKEQLFFVEPTLPRQFYPCSIDDICAVLEGCDEDDLKSFDFIVFRQPTTKQRVLAHVWGRAVFAIDIDQFWGSAIIIESQSVDGIKWGKSLTPEDAKELRRLRSDGHEVTVGRRAILISPTSMSLRNTVLYRTLLHEIGHHLDYSRTELEAWAQKTTLLKEDYAHGYAEEQANKMRLAGVIPFPSKLDAESLAKDNLKQEWFAPESSSSI